MNLKKLFVVALSTLLCFTTVPHVVFASDGQDITSFTTNAVRFLSLFATTIATVFLIKGGYQYMTSSGNPDKLESAKKTMRNVCIGLLLVLSATTFSQILQTALTPTDTVATQTISLPKMQNIPPAPGISQVLTDAVTGFLQNMIESGTKPVIDGITGFLTTTPSLMSNQTIIHFWLISVGIADSLFVLVIILLGLQVMSTSMLGFEETTLSQILPRLVIAFLGIHVSLLLMDSVITLCNALVTSLLGVTGGIDHAWILTAFSTNNIFLHPQSIPLLTLLFFAFFLLLSVVLLLLYITRLITIGLAAVLSPFLFLLWAVPRFSDFAEIAAKSYVVSVFIVFVHIVIIQLASAMLTVPGEKITDNAFLSVLVGIGMFFMLLKTPSFLMQLVLYTKGQGIIKLATRQVTNVLFARNKDKEQKIPETVPAKGEFVPT